MAIWKASGFEPISISTNKLRNLPHTCKRDQEKGPGFLPAPRVHRSLKESHNQREAPQVGTSGFASCLINRMFLLNTNTKMICQYTNILVSHSCSGKYFPFRSEGQGSGLSLSPLSGLPVVPEPLANDNSVMSCGS